ncbi:MAG: penicillin-binding protein 2 [Nitrospinae bacterium CG11_big_fil_rev_8_21_14_0_20_56_8]|nr:MAG: penicillin-binding protein 2 [Nitrospinae bacterium CG11_big_fil_rev_8_21_14_0_20_56_8]
MSFHRYSIEISDNVRKKIKFYAILVVVCFLCLWMRVWYLQILKGESLSELSENNRVRLVSLPALRGTILDRNMETLVSIRPSFNLYVTPEDTLDLNQTLARLKQRIDFKEDRLKKGMKEARPFQDVLIKADISREEVAFVEENKMRLPGIHINVEPLRSYLQNEMGAHILGYLGEISKRHLERFEETDYQLGDLVGKDGVESAFEEILRGNKGYKEVEVDVSGRELNTLRKLPPESGNNLILTLDARIQKEVERLMTGTEEESNSGAVVVMKVQTGEIIAITSKPSFDPNLFAAGISREDWSKLIKDEMHPLQNRAINGQYPPGSVYKIVTALAALEEGVITPESTVFCPGHFRLGRGKYRCWKKGGHGTVNLHRALVESCDVYFYTLGFRLGVDRLAKYAKMLGLGNYTGIPLNGEKPGLIPSTEWKLKTRNESWLPGETISAAIGQGYNLVTPIQDVNMLAMIANGGLLYKPYLVKKIEDSEGKILQEFSPELVSKIHIHPDTLKAIREGLRGVVNEAGGTGGRARLNNIVLAGKTGTAQVVRMKSEEMEVDEEIPYPYRDHAWFAAYAPFEKPEIAVAVLVEHGGHGGATAAPIVREIFKIYFKYYPPAPPQEESSPIGPS